MVVSEHVCFHPATGHIRQASYPKYDVLLAYWCEPGPSSGRGNAAAQNIEGSIEARSHSVGFLQLATECRELIPVGSGRRENLELERAYPEVEQARRERGPIVRAAELDFVLVKKDGQWRVGDLKRLCLTASGPYSRWETQSQQLLCTIEIDLVRDVIKAIDYRPAIDPKVCIVNVRERHSSASRSER